MIAVIVPTLVTENRLIIDVCVTKVREVTKARNFLGPLRKCTLQYLAPNGLRGA
jgi:hypothetical protein